MKKNTFIAIAFIILVTSGLSAKNYKIKDIDPPTEKTGSEYFPLYIGAKWTWEADGYDETKIIKWEIVSAHSIADKVNELKNVTAFKIVSEEIKDEWYVLEHDGYICFYREAKRYNLLDKILPVEPSLDAMWEDNNNAYVISDSYNDIFQVEKINKKDNSYSYYLFTKGVGPSEVFESVTVGKEKKNIKLTLNNEVEDDKVNDVALNTEEPENNNNIEISDKEEASKPEKIEEKVAQQEEPNIFEESSTANDDALWEELEAKENKNEPEEITEPTEQKETIEITELETNEPENVDTKSNNNLWTEEEMVSTPTESVETAPQNEPEITEDKTDYTKTFTPTEDIEVKEEIKEELPEENGPEIYVDESNADEEDAALNSIDYSYINNLSKKKQYIQIGAFEIIKNAKRIYKEAMDSGYSVKILQDSDNYYRVLVEFSGKDTKILKNIRKNIARDAFVKKR